MELGGYMPMPMYTVAKIPMEKPTSEKLDFVPPKCSVRNSMICCLWNSIQRPLSWKGNICLKKSFEEKPYKPVGTAWYIYSLV